MYNKWEKEMQTECLICGLGSCVEGHLVWLQSRN